MKSRSENEIKVWLITRFWYKKYMYNLMKENPDEADNYLDGKMGPYTLSSAFTYRNTPEGIEYWGKKEEKFLIWYYHQKREVFRCRWFTIQI